MKNIVILFTTMSMVDAYAYTTTNFEDMVNGYIDGLLGVNAEN